MNKIFRIKFKYIENSDMDTIAYSRACKALDEQFNKNAILAVGKDEKEVHEKTLYFVSSNTSFKIRNDSFRVTISEVDTVNGFIDTGRTVSTTPTSIWDADLK